MGSLISSRQETRCSRRTCRARDRPPAGPRSHETPRWRSRQPCLGADVSLRFSSLVYILLFVDLVYIHSIIYDIHIIGIIQYCENGMHTNTVYIYIYIGCYICVCGMHTVYIGAPPQFLHTTIEGRLMGAINFIFKGNIQHA